MRMLLTGGGAGIALEWDLLSVAPEERRIMVVGVALAIVAEDVVNALLLRIANRVVHAEAPFADQARDIPGRLEQAGDGGGILRDRLLAVGFGFEVVADLSVPGMLAGHEHASRR